MPMPPVINIRSVTNNVGWSILSKISTFGLKFVTVPILARILTPAEFGAVAVALTVVQFLAMIGGAGLAAALVIERDDDEEAVHTVFWSNLAIALVLAACVYAGSDWFARMMGAPGATPLLEAMSLLIPIQLSTSVAFALLARRMAFSKDAQWSVVSETLGALTAVGLALLGWGVWSLVIQQFVAAVVRLAGLSIASGYRPRAVVSFSRLGGLLSYSLGIMGAEISNFISFQSPLIIISRSLGIGDAGAYSASNRFASIPNQVVLTAFMGVLFPAFGHMADDPQRRSQALMLSSRVTTLLIAPMMFGLWAIAEPAMRILFGSQWAYAWPVLGLLALSKGIMSPCSTFIPYLKGVGAGTALWWTSVSRAALTIASVGLGASLGGLHTAMVALCIANAITLVGYSWVVFRVDGTAFIHAFLKTSRPMFFAIVMAVLVRFLLEQLQPTLPGTLSQVLVGGFAGTVIYCMLIYLTEKPLVWKLADMARRGKASAAGAGA